MFIFLKRRTHFLLMTKKPPLEVIFY